MSFLIRPNTVHEHREFEKVEVAYRILPKARYSGDHCQVVRYNKHRYGLVVADSSKLGKPAQVQAQDICESLIDRIKGGRDPKSALQDVAKDHVDIDERFTTLVYADILMHSSKGVMSVYRAGHELPIHISSKKYKSRKMKRPQIRALPIGVSDLTNGTRLDNGQVNCTRAYEAKPIMIKPGDFIAFYSDGITEARDQSGEDLERSGLERALRNVIRGRRVRQPVTIIDETLASLGGYTAHDDVSLLVAKINDY
jgi:serine phosphatase RsbU (regulator of sigma subunit)